MYKIFIQSLAAALMLAGLSGCATNPVSGKKQLAFMSEEQEISLGKRTDPEVVREYGLYPDSNLQRFIQQKGEEMAKICHRPNLRYTFRVLDSDVINAFALPGGYVYFTRGILAHLNDEAQFAGVLGHEIGHITARHTVSQQTKQTLAQLGVLAAVIYDPRLAQFAEGAGAGLQLLFLKFSREAEHQSDELGVEYSSKIGYDAREMAKFFQTLERTAEASHSTLPEFLSTHPNPGNRFARITQLAGQYQEANGLKNLKINRDSYLRSLEGLLYGEDPKQGFLEKGVFYHPTLGFQFNAPPNFTYKNTPSQVIFSPKDGSALFFLSLAAGNSPELAARNYINSAQFQVMSARYTNVNGLNAYAIMGDQQQRDQQGRVTGTVRAIIYFIQQNNTIYKLAAAASPEKFNYQYYSLENYITTFSPLRDPSKLNIKPERIRVLPVTTTGTLQEALNRLAIPANRHQELAILNGMQLNDRLEQGTLIKIVVRM